MNATYSMSYMHEMNVEKTWRDWVRHALVTDLFLVISFYITLMLSIDLSAIMRKNANEHSSRTYKKMMKIAAVLLGVSVTIHFADGIFEEVVVDFYQHSWCGASKWIKAISGSFAFLFSYLVMWIRQRSIYSEPSMRHLTKRSFRILSLLVILLVVASPVANTIIYCTSFSFAVVQTGCSIVGSTLNPQTPWIIIGVSSAVMQSILLTLFVLPLYRHHANMADSSSQGTALKPLIIRSLVTSSVCTITDTGTAILAASSVFNDGVTIGVAMQISIFINLAMVLLSFPEWKRTVFPCCWTREATESHFRPNTSTSDSTAV